MMKMLYFIFMVLSVVLALTACAEIDENIVVEEETVSVENGFDIEELEYDFGLIKQSGGIVSHDFLFTYHGEEEIKITSVPASCLCTSAEVDKASYIPGESGVLTVYFDPNLHAEPEGRFYKSVSILTEPALDELPEVKIWQEIDLDLGEEFFELKEAHDDDHEDDDHA